MSDQSMGADHHRACRASASVIDFSTRGTTRATCSVNASVKQLFNEGTHSRLPSLPPNASLRKRRGQVASRSPRAVLRRPPPAQWTLWFRIQQAQ
jgi:hypothetical protein